jgi:lipopolysaccharide/colanic/teichoic acid biosynthesis glycosyltransferase
VKRSVDLLVGFIAILVLSPLVVLLAVLIWLGDRRSPFYVAQRVGRNGQLFKMVKLRSMIAGADQAGVDSTGNRDPRITPVGSVVRQLKLDEIPQLWNVFRGDMSLVGPRPNITSEVALYTPVERRLLAVRPGMTDLASIVFADEGEILADSEDPNRDYNRLIRPWKSRLGLLYVAHGSPSVDALILFATACSFVSRKRALRIVSVMLERWGAPSELVRVSRRDIELRPAPPPGASQISDGRRRALTAAEKVERS